MPRMRLNRITAALLFGISASGALSEPLERSVSPSRQFLIYGTNAQLRGAMSDAAEQVKANLLSILRQPDNWKTPIIVNLQFPQANLPDVPKSALYFSQTGAGLKLQLDLIIGADIHAPRIQRDLLRAILLERIYRAHSDIAPGSAYVEPPEWLLDGLLAAAPGYDRTPLADAAKSLAENKVVPLEEFLRQHPERLDSPGQSIYRACALALVQSLVDGSEGGARLARYIDNLSSASNDPIADLKSNFPALSANDIEKIWQSNVMKLSASQRFELLTFAETERRLDESLQIKLAKKTARLEEFLHGKLSSSDKAALQRLTQDLMLTGAAANPVMRPIVNEYQQIAERLLAGKRKGIAERLARLRATRTKLVARMNEVDDYLNWFEATQSKTSSGIFADYLRTAAERDERNARRRDAMSVYLDAIAQQIH